MKTLREVFHVLWGAIKDLWGEFFPLLLMNFVTMGPVILLLILFYGAATFSEAGHPTVAGIFLALGVTSLALFSPALAGLWNVANRVADRLAIHWSDYFEGFRSYFWKSLGLGLINLVVLAILISNIWFYAPANDPFQMDASISSSIQLFFIVLTALWLVYQMYPLALLMEQTDKRLRIAYRNAGVLFITRAGFSILLALALAIVIAISTYPFVVPWFFITLSFIAVACNKAVKHLLIPHRERAAQEAVAEQDEQETDEA
jgi:uncharacterized membrane protein YesL